MDPFVVGILLRVVLLPAGVCLAARLLAGLAAPRAARAREAIVALGATLAFTAALYASDIRPSLPLAPYEDAWAWVFWIAPAAAVLGIVGAFAKGPEVLRIVSRWVIATGAAWLIVRPLVPHALSSTSALGRAAAAGFVAEGLWSALATRAKRGGGIVGVLPLAPPLLATGGILLEFGHSIAMASAAGALAVAVGASAYLGRRDPAPLPPAVAPVVALVFAGLLLGAHAYLNYGDAVGFPWETGLLLAAAAACVALPKPWLATALSALLVAAAAYVAARLGTSADPAA